VTVVIDARYDPETGVGRYVTGLRRALRQSGRRRYLFLEAGEDSADGVHVRSKAFSITEQVEVPVLLAAARPQALHVPHFIVPILWPGSLIVTVHDVIPLDFPDSLSSRMRSLYPLMLRIACARAVRVIVPSIATREELVRRRLVSEQRIIVTPYAAPDVEETSTPIVVHGPYVLAVALLRSHKNLQVLIRAFASLSGRRDDLKLVIVGEGPQRRSLEQLSADLGVSGRVLLLPRQSDSALSALHSHASVFVSPSLVEGFGLTVLEAMARGIPVITSTAAALVETAGGASLTFDPHQPEELAALIERVLDDAALRGDLRIRGMQRVRALSWTRMAEATERVYDSVLKT
jgi:glycosyltransferase involved in cell wall biosynthesis